MEKRTIRFTSIILLIILFGGLFLRSYCKNNTEPKDLNVYLNEEVCFADEIFIKVVGLSVEKDENITETYDIDGDLLSEYTLNLIITIQQRHTDLWVNRITIKSEMFALKSVNLESKSKMQIFFSSLAQITMQTAVELLVGGTVEGTLEYGVIDAIETSLNFAKEYTEESIENAKIQDIDFNPIKATKNQFEPFKPRENLNEITEVKLSFPIKKEYLESKNIMVLTIDKIDKWEKRIFLMPRPINR